MSFEYRVSQLYAVELKDDSGNDLSVAIIEHIVGGTAHEWMKPVAQSVLYYLHVHEKLGETMTTLQVCALLRNV